MALQEKDIDKLCIDTQENDINENNTQQPKIDLTRFKFEPFNATQESWKYYKQRFDLDINVSGLQNNFDAQRILLLKWIGADHYKIITDNFDPKPILSVSYKDIIEFLNSFYNRRTSYLAERLKFGKILKTGEQSIALFLNNLRSGATECQFKGSLEERIRDQFLFGLNDPKMQEELIRSHPEEDAKLNDIVRDATLLELARSQQKEINIGNGIQEENVNKVKSYTFTKKFDIKKDINTNKAENCLRCGHLRHKQIDLCPALNATCNYCGKTGHFKKVCFKSQNDSLAKNKKFANQITDKMYTREIDANEACSSTYVPNDRSLSIPNNMYNNENELKKSNQFSRSYIKDRSSHDFNPVNQINQSSGGKFSYVVNLHIQNVPITMEYDTAAARTIISKSTWTEIGSPTLTPTHDLGAYPSFRIKMLGEARVKVQLDKITKDLNVAVTDSERGTPLFGKDWITAFEAYPNCKHVLRCDSSFVNKVSKINFDTVKLTREIYREFSDIITDQLGTIKNFEAKVRVPDDIKLPVHKPRPVPFALQKATNKEIDRLVSVGVLEPVDPSVTPIICASPIVVVPKGNGEVRICGDFKVSINPHLADDDYNIPTFEETTLKLNNSKIFSVIDLKDAYLQLPVDEKSKQFLVIATQKGYFTYNRLPFGIKTAPKIFQKLMDQLLIGVDNVAWYFDDICVGGENGAEHLQQLRKVLSILRKTGLCTREDKLQLFKESVVYLGHKISSEGIQPVEDRVKAIQNQPAPTNVSELRSFLGAINYYSRFIPNLQSLCFPLHRLLHKNTVWRWNDECEKSFNSIKASISENMTLVHYDPKRPLILATDASNQGLGAILLQEGTDGTQKPIAAASRTLNSSEENYSSIDKEGLAIIFGIDKFYKYIYGRHFTLLCDHKPLERIFGSRQAIPKHAASRLARWAIILSGYDYDIKYTAGKDNVLADCLSRLPLKESCDHKHSEVNQVRSMRIEDLPMTKQVIKNHTQKDQILNRVVTYCLRGWPEKKDLSEPLKLYHDKRLELSYEEGIILWQERIVIPFSLRQSILEYLHVAHPGIVAMRSLAKMYVYWPKIDKDIEDLVNSCERCQMYRRKDPETPLNSWNIPENAWERIHIDFKGPFQGYMWLVIVDAYSRWLEVFPMKHATSHSVINCLRELFCRYGLVKKLVTDNGKCFISDEFEDFCKRNNITHVKTTPYHSRSNGSVERVIQTFQNKYLMTEYNDHVQRLQTILLSYRSTPHSSTGKTPAELFFNRRIRIFMDTLKPDVRETMQRSQDKQKYYHDLHSRGKDFNEGDLVWVKRNKNELWKQGTVLRRTNPLSYRVSIGNQEFRQHSDHLRPRSEKKNDLRFENEELEGNCDERSNIETEAVQTEQLNVHGDGRTSIGDQILSREQSFPNQSAPELRRSQRVIRKPKFYHDEY